MKIVSSFRDYYDRVAHEHGGGDPKITYVRDRLVPLDRKTIRGHILESNIQMYHPIWVPDSHAFKADGKYPMCHDYATLIVCGRPYVLRQTKRYMAYITNEIAPDSYEKGWHLEMGEKQRQYDAMISAQSTTELANILRVSRELNAPVFVCASKYSIWSRVPILKDIGFARLKSAEELYQELAFFIANELPVKMEQPAMTDVQKVEAHGFDKRQSFRHRK